MSDMIYKSGLDIRKILNKSFAKYETTHAKHIVLGLDKSNIPYFARFGNTSISLTYDADYKDSVDEIITKAMSGDFGELLREIKDKNNSEEYLILLPEIAPMLHTTVGALKNRPSEIQESLCRTYHSPSYPHTACRRQAEYPQVCGGAYPLSYAGALPPQG